MAREYKDLPLEDVMHRYASKGRDPFMFAIHMARYRFAAGRLTPDSRVLDIGCAYGFGAEELAGAAREVTGLDTQADAVAYAQEHHAAPNVTYEACDAMDYTCAAASLDAITAFEVIEHLQDPCQLLARCVTWLKPGGRLIVSTPNKLVHLLMGVKWEFHEREYGYSELWDLLRSHFEEKDIEILGQNAHMLAHFRGKRGRFTPYATPLRKLVWATVPRPAIRALRRVFPKKPAPVASDDPVLEEAVAIGTENVDLADTFIAVGRRSR
jgi:SAM-dependent methyltransferase